MKTVLVFYGKKQSGKSSATKFVTGHYLVKHGICNYYNISPDGELLTRNTQDEPYKVLNIDDDSWDYSCWASQNLWPHCKNFAFADELKVTCSRIFGLDLKILKGTDKQKNAKTHIEWNVMGPFLTSAEIKQMKTSKKWFEKMSHREILQEFGSRICRTIDNECWVRRTYQDIISCGSGLSIIQDGRFPNELEYSIKQNSKDMQVFNILLERSILKDSHASETCVSDLDKSKMSLIVPKDISMPEAHQMIKKFLQEKGVW